MSFSMRDRYSRSVSRSPSRSHSRSPYVKGRTGRPMTRSRSRSRSRSYDYSDAENPGNNLYVTGLSSRSSRRDIEKHFASEGGKVMDVHLVTDPRTRESRGFAFVTMSSLKDADRCLKYLDRSVLDGRVITVEKARRRRGRTPTPGRYLGAKTLPATRRSPGYSPYSSGRSGSYEDDSRRSYSPPYNRRGRERYRSRSRSYSRGSRSPLYYRRRYSYSRDSRSPYYNMRHYSRQGRYRSYSRSRSPYDRRDYHSHSSRRDRSYSPYYRRRGCHSPYGRRSRSYTPDERSWSLYERGSHRRSHNYSDERVEDRKMQSRSPSVSVSVSSGPRNTRSPSVRSGSRSRSSSR